MAARRSSPDSRGRILKAAAIEFAAHGFSAAGVDRIAARAHVNKAMIYYHFANKTSLYREILREMFVATAERFELIAAEPGPATARLEAFVEALVREGQARPHFPPMMLRELAEGGRHLDSLTLRAMGRPYQAVRRVILEGIQHGHLAPVQPLLAYFTMVGPIILYLANAPLRRRMQRQRIVDHSGTDPAAFVAHLRRLARSALVPPAPPVRSRGARLA